MTSPKQSNPRWDAVERFAGKLLLSCIFSLLLFWIADYLGPSLFGAQQRGAEYFPKEVYFEPHPFIGHKGTSLPDLQASHGLNRLGYRGPLPSREKKPQEYRIALIGGSTVLSGNPTIAELLEKYLHEGGRPNVAVYNFGVAASNLRMDLARFVFEVADYKPDLVIFYGGGNDIGMPYQADPRPTYPPNFLAYENNPLILAGTSNQSWATLLKLALFHSRIIRVSAGERLRASLVPLDRVRREVGWNTETWSGIVAESYLDGVRRAQQLVPAFNAHAIFIFQPILPFKLNPTPNEESLLDEPLRSHARRCRSIITEGLLRLHEQDNVSYADASSVFDPVRDQVFSDGIHIHQEYQETVAREVLKAVNLSFVDHPSLADS